MLAGCVLVCCTLHFDLLGIASRVPEASQIQTLEVRTADNSYTLTPEQDGDLVEQIRAIHQAIVADKAHVQALDDSRDLTLSEEADPNTTHTGLRLTYSLNNGTRVERWYYLPITRDRLAQPETYDHLLDQFVNSDIVKARRLHLNDDFWTVSSGSLYLEARGESYDLGSREASAVLQAVGRDLASGGWGNYDWFSSSDSDSYAIYLELGFDGPDGEGHDWISINVTPDTVETGLPPGPGSGDRWGPGDLPGAVSGGLCPGWLQGCGVRYRRGDCRGLRCLRRRGGVSRMSRTRTRRRHLNLRFAALCLFLIFALAGALVWFLSSRGLPGEDVAVPDYVQQDFLTVNPWSRPGTPLEKIDGVVIHYVGNPDTTAQANRNYFESLSSGEEGTYASSHFVVGLEGEVIQCIPLTEIAYASNTRNADTVAIEVCHPDETGQFSPVTYQRVVELTAWLCRPSA